MLGIGKKREASKSKYRTRREKEEEDRGGGTDPTVHKERIEGCRR